MKPTKVARSRAFLVVLSALALAAAASAQEEVGTVVALRGELEVQHAGAGEWQPALPGSRLFARDRVRTGADTTAKLILLDESVLDLAPSTQLAIEKVRPASPTAKAEAQIRLLGGKMRALASESYAPPHGGRFEIATPTAFVAAPSCEVVVLYNSRKKYTDVVPVDQSVIVQGTLGVIGPGVTMNPQELTRVRSGKFPSPPRPIDEALLARYRSDLETVGTGTRENLDTVHAASIGRVLRPEDQPPGVGEAREKTAEPPRLVVPPPGDTLPERLSPETRTSDQPIPEFRQAPPGQRPSGGVDVDF